MIDDKSLVTRFQAELHDVALGVKLEPVVCAWVRKAGLSLWVRRDDLIDPAQSGNKFYKLFYNLKAARLAGASELVSYGGPWSNHLYALAAAARECGIPARGIVRGEQPLSLSLMLNDVQSLGMQLQFVSRSDYRHYTHGGTNVQGVDNSIYSIPEGGANLLGAAGMMAVGWALRQQIDGDFQACIACGTGTSLAGVVTGLGAGQRVLGFSVLKGAGSLGAQIHDCVVSLEGILPDSTKGVPAAGWALISGFHGGGYGRAPGVGLYQFWQDFEQETGMLLDPVYTLKLFWGIYCLAQQGYWPRGTRLVAIHTGGLQGRRGFVCPEDPLTNS